MDAFDKLLAEAKQHASKKKAKKKTAKKLVDKKVYGSSDPGHAVIRNPWEDEALVLVMTIQRCRQCDSEHTSYNPHLFLERTRIVNNHKERLLERISNCNYEQLYFQYPQRIEVREVVTCACPTCFGINNRDDRQLQLELPFLLKEQTE